MYNPVSRSYGEPHKRPEVQNATIEFIAPSEYMVCFNCFYLLLLLFVIDNNLVQKKSMARCYFLNEIRQLFTENLIHVILIQVCLNCTEMCVCVIVVCGLLTLTSFAPICSDVPS